MEDEQILNNIVKWWEKKRLWFNIILAVIGIGMIIIINPYYFGFKDFLGIIIWGIGANIFFSLGILAEIFDLYYLKSRLSLKNFRWIFLIIGTLFSSCYTMMTILNYYNQLTIG